MITYQCSCVDSCKLYRKETLGKIMGSRDLACHIQQSFDEGDILFEVFTWGIHAN
jgi:hypothetical protein